MTRVLYIANLLEKSGWGNQCRHIAKSLNSVGNLDVVCRPVVLGMANKVDSEIESLIKKSNRGKFDFVIQMVLPHHMMYQGGAKNFGIVLTETTNLKNHYWTDYINLMDEVWYPNEEFIKEVKKPQYVIPPPVNVDKYYKKYPIPTISGLEGRYKFYTICENNKRKNILGLIIAFYKAFSYDDMTALIIKVNKFGSSPKEISELMESKLISIQQESGLQKKFPPVVFITDYYTEEQICGLHKYCDCYVAPSFGEAVNYPLLDACGFGNHGISSDVSGPRYMNKKGLPVSLIEVIKQPCFGADKFFPGHNTIMEDWSLTNLNLFSEEMKSLVSTSKQIKYTTNMNHFSYENVGEEMLERLYSQ